MTDRFIRYRSGYKYQLSKDYKIKTSIKPNIDIDTQFISLDTVGELTVSSGYAWDGVSGPVLDTDSNLRASLVHDAFYQLIRNRKLSRKKHKDKADRLFRSMCKEDGVLPALAQIYYIGLKNLGNPATDPKNAKKIKRAP